MKYRHATRRAENYYLEGLKRDKTDIRLNNAYGMLLFKKGYIDESEQYFRAAIRKTKKGADSAKYIAKSAPKSPGI